MTCTSSASVQRLAWTYRTLSFKPAFCPVPAWVLTGSWVHRVRSASALLQARLRSRDMPSASTMSSMLHEAYAAGKCRRTRCSKRHCGGQNKSAGCLSERPAERLRPLAYPETCFAHVRSGSCRRSSNACRGPCRRQEFQSSPCRHPSGQNS